MESCIRISISEYIDLDQSQRFDHSGRNDIWREPFPPARTCDIRPGAMRRLQRVPAAEHEPVDSDMAGCRPSSHWHGF